MKKIVLTVILSVISTALTVFSVQKFYFSKPENIYIAVAGPISATFGQEMAQGIQMYIDEVNAGGGVAGKKINLTAFNDKNQEKEATEAASEISGDERILMVLGHGSSPASLAASGIYKKNGVPAVTASATAKRITEDNNWYFRVLSDNGFQGKFIAHYGYNILKKTFASVIYEADEWGTVFAENFETEAHELGMEIKKKWALNSEKEDIDKDLSKITGELRAMDDPGLIFLAVRADEGVKIISGIKYPAAKYVIMGPDFFTTENFIRKLSTYPLEQAIPGYYSDDIYAICPFLMDTADAEAYRFRDAFVKKYGKTPSWVAARYYDAAKIAVEAIKKSDIRTQGPIQYNRKEIRAALESINSPEMAVRGVCGNIYFDKNRNDIGTGLSVGMYKNQRFVPAFFQYQAGEPGSEDIVEIEGRVLHKTSVVFTGIKVNEIGDLNIKQSSFAADFYLWFRYKDEFEDMSDIRFVNALSPVPLGFPVENRSTAEGVSVRAYHVRAAFGNRSDFHRFPFDRQTLYIRFRHSELPKQHLIYVPDRTAISSQTSVADDETGQILLNPLSGWKIGGAECRQDILSDDSAQFFGSEQVFLYSQFNAEVHIERQGVYTAVGTFLPLIVLLINLYLIYVMPRERQRLRISIVTVLSLTAVFCHWKLRAELPADYTILAEYAFFTAYGLLAMSAGICFLLFLFRKQGNEQKAERILRAGKILYLPVTGAGLLLMYLY